MRMAFLAVAMSVMTGSPFIDTASAQQMQRVKDYKGLYLCIDPNDNMHKEFLADKLKYGIAPFIDATVIETCDMKQIALIPGSTSKRFAFCLDVKEADEMDKARLGMKLALLKMDDGDIYDIFTCVM